MLIVIVMFVLLPAWRINFFICSIAHPSTSPRSPKCSVSPSVH